MNNRLHDVNLPKYHEAAALQQMLQALNRELAADYDRMDADPTYEGGQFTITVGGVQTAFLLGGVQAEGLYAFVQYIAEENYYEVDFDNGTVVGD